MGRARAKSGVSSVTYTSISPHFASCADKRAERRPATKWSIRAQLFQELLRFAETGIFR